MIATRSSQTHMHAHAARRTGRSGGRQYLRCASLSTRCGRLLQNAGGQTTPAIPPALLRVRSRGTIDHRLQRRLGVRALHQRIERASRKLLRRIVVAVYDLTLTTSSSISRKTWRIAQGVDIGFQPPRGGRDKTRKFIENLGAPVALFLAGKREAGARS